MKTGVIINLLCSVAAAALIVCLHRERRTWYGWDQANKGLRLQLSQIEALLADNQRLLALLPTDASRSSQSNQGVDPVSTMSEPAKELLRLRGEAEALRQENKT